MGKKNKKIKKLCPHCHHRNVFGKNKWFGADKTRCKSCNNLLVKIKEYELPIIKGKFTKKKLITKETMQDITCPALRPIKEKGQKKPWWVLGLIVLTFIVAGAFILDNNDKNNFSINLSELNDSNLRPPPASQEICKEINGVPAWVQTEEILGYGYDPKLKVPFLIENGISFFYSNTCPVCHEQIDAFGNEWGVYQLSRYAIECW